MRTFPNSLKVVVLLSAATVSMAQPLRIAGVDQPPTLTVRGTGSVSVKPDFATVQLGAEAQRPTAAEAQAEVNSIMNETLKSIRDLGVPDRAIRTTGLSLSPVYDSRVRPSNREPQLYGYRASNMVQVELDDLALIGKVVDAGMNSGMNRLAGISFGIRDDLQHRIQALKRASDQAQSKAAAIADALDVTLVDVYTVEEDGGGGLPRYHTERAMMAMAESTPIEPGQLQIEASLSVTFRIQR